MSDFQESTTLETAPASGEITIADLRSQVGSLGDQSQGAPEPASTPAPTGGEITAADLNADKPAADAPAPAAQPAAEAPPKQEATTLPATTPAPFDPAAVLQGEAADAAAAHLAGGKFKTAAELNAALADLPTDAERALLAHHRSGAKLSEIAAVLDTDWQQKPPLDVLRAAFERDNADLASKPDLLSDAWDDYVVNSFPRGIPADDDDSNAAALARRDLNRAADPERVKFEAEKAKYSTLPTAANAAETQAQQQAAQDAALAQWAESAAAAATEIKTLPFSYDTPAGKQTATLEIGELSAEDRQAVQDPLNALGWVKADGSWDAAKVAADTLYLRRREAASNLLVAQGRAAEASDTMQRLRNPSDNPNNQASGAQSIMEQLQGQTPLTHGPSRN